MSISIKLKIGIPVAILTAIIIALMGMGILTLKKSSDHSQNISSWFQENGDILRINHKISEFMYPHVRLTMGQDFENNDRTREQIRQKQKELDFLFKDIQNKRHLTTEETDKLTYLNTRFIALRLISKKILALKLPQQHQQGMRLIHELATNHIKPINVDLNSWYEQDIEKVTQQQELADQESQNYFKIVAALTALTIFALILAIWVNNQSVIKPVLQIKKITASLARGDLKQRIDLPNKDEFGELSRDINNMASSLDSINRQLSEAARTDGLTGIFNRRSCEELLDQHFSSSIRYDMIFSIIMLDIDHFKQINDEYGHAPGDQALKEIADICQKQIRDCDFVFRYGGEEFLILLPNTDKNDSIVVAERIRKAIRNTAIEIETAKLKLTASLGISSFPEDGLEKTELVRNADNALYRAKENGRNQTVAFEKPLLF